jgi:enoyl-CoA hydratase
VSDNNGVPVVIERPEPGIAVVRLNRPDRLNALTPAMVDSIVDALRGVGRDRGVRVVVLTGSGRAFCAGLDLSDFSAGGEEREGGAGPGSASPVTHFDGQERFAAMVRAVRSIDQPVIAAINGPVAGAGMGLALSADIRVCSESARFHVAAVKVGLSAGECGMSWHLPRLVGMSRAMEIFLTGRPVGSAEAERIGLVSRVIPDGAVVDAALELGRAISANSPFGVRMTKRVAWQNLEVGFEAALELENRTQILALMTEDSREAIEAFLAKRTAGFTGR